MIIPLFQKLTNHLFHPNMSTFSMRALISVQPTVVSHLSKKNILYFNIERDYYTIQTLNYVSIQLNLKIFTVVE